MLAFTVRGEASPEPAVDQQDTYAVHPIKDYGFKVSLGTHMAKIGCMLIWTQFLVNAGFLLVASRQDVDASSKWNVTLRTSIWDAYHLEEAK